MPEQFEEKLDEILTAIVAGFETMEERFDAVGKRFVKLENKTDHLLDEVGKVGLRYGDLRQELVDEGVLSK
jgi:predicted nuclease with TOPRIM domain